MNSASVSDYVFIIIATFSLLSAIISKCTKLSETKEIIVFVASIVTSLALLFYGISHLVATSSSAIITTKTITVNGKEYANANGSMITLRFSEDNIPIAEIDGKKYAILNGTLHDITYAKYTASVDNGTTYEIIDGKVQSTTATQQN